MTEPVIIEAVSKKGTTRIGLKPVPAIIEQDQGHQIFVVFPQHNQCRWMLKQNDPHFRIVS